MNSTTSNGHKTRTEYPIADREGHIVAIHVRDDSSPDGKRFSWKQPDGSWGLNGTRNEELPLYGSHQVDTWPADETVIVVEGEKAAQALLDAGLNTVGTVTGAGGTPGPEALEELRGREVILWPDNDEAGRAHMDRLAERLHGVAAEVRMYKWHEAPEKGADAADHPAVRSGDRKAVDRLFTDLLDAPKWIPQRPPNRLRDSRMLLAQGIEEGIEPPEELEPDVLLKGRVHDIYSGPGTGKTMLLLWLIKNAVERGEKVALFDMENGPRIVAERLRQMGVDTSRVNELLFYFPYTNITLAREDVEDYAALLAEERFDLVAFDSWINFLAASGGDENSSNDIARWAVAYTQPARALGTTVVLLDHVPHEGNHARGSTRKKDEVDVQWKLFRTQPFDRDSVGEIVLHREKDREGWLPPSVKFSVGGGADGLVFERSSGTIEQPASDGLTESQRKALDILRAEFGSKGATATEWQKATEGEISRGTFFRARRELVKQEKVLEREKRYYPTSDPDGFDDTSNDTSEIRMGKPNQDRYHKVSSRSHQPRDTSEYQVSPGITPLQGDTSDTPARPQREDDPAGDAYDRLVEDRMAGLAGELDDIIHSSDEVYEMARQRFSDHGGGGTPT